MNTELRTKVGNKFQEKSFESNKDNLPGKNVDFLKKRKWLVVTWNAEECIKHKVR